MKTLLVNNVLYHHKVLFDANITIQYENDRWGKWHIVREFISNALDSVNGDVDRVSITNEGDFILIADGGPGYPIAFAKRIGASSKKNNENSIGQFGEGTKLALLTCLRIGIQVRLASQNWLIEPKKLQDEDGLEVMAFDIYESSEHIIGSLVNIEADREIQDTIDNKHDYFLQFNTGTPLFGNFKSGIYPKGDKAKIFNKGVFIKSIDAMYNYAISINELNRDRDIIDEDMLCGNIRDVWNSVDKQDLMKAYFQESYYLFKEGISCRYKEFVYSIYPIASNKELWRKTFFDMFGGKALLFTNDLAAREAMCLGYATICLDYYGKNLAESLNIQKDIDFIRKDYEFIFAEKLTPKERQRLKLFHQITQMLALPYPASIRVYETYAKSENILGVYNTVSDEIMIKRSRLNDELPLAVETFLHELAHKVSGADDLDRNFANWLTMLMSQTVLGLSENVGLPINIKLTDKGLKMPADFSYSANNMQSHFAIINNELIIHTAGITLRTTLEDTHSKPYCASKQVKYHKGNFYLCVPENIRRDLPGEMEFYAALNLAKA